MEKKIYFFCLPGNLNPFPLTGFNKSTVQLSEKFKNQMGIGDPMLALANWQTA